MNNGIISMPKELIGRFHNGSCTESCDMLQGPCACGASHHLNEWVIRKKKFTKKGWVDPSEARIKELEVKNEKLKSLLSKALGSVRFYNYKLLEDIEQALKGGAE